MQLTTWNPPFFSKTPPAGTRAHTAGTSPTTRRFPPYRHCPFRTFVRSRNIRGRRVILHREARDAPSLVGRSGADSSGRCTRSSSIGSSESSRTTNVATLRRRRRTVRSTLTLRGRAAYVAVVQGLRFVHVLDRRQRLLLLHAVLHIDRVHRREIHSQRHRLPLLRGQQNLRATVLVVRIDQLRGVRAAEEAPFAAVVLRARRSVADRQLAQVAPGDALRVYERRALHGLQAVLDERQIQHVLARGDRVRRDAVEIVEAGLQWNVRRVHVVAVGGGFRVLAVRVHPETGAEAVFNTGLEARKVAKVLPQRRVLLALCLLLLQILQRGQLQMPANVRGGDHLVYYRLVYYRLNTR